MDQDTAGALLHVLRKAREFMANTAVGDNALGDQDQVIECVENKSKALGWRTYFP